MKKRHHSFNRESLPDPLNFYRIYFPRLNTAREWTSALCPFHGDKQPSLSINLRTGGFLCHACGARGGNVLDFYKLRFGVDFVEAAKILGAWEEK